MKNNNENSALNKPVVSSRLIQEAILNDENLKWLYQQKAKVYENVVPKMEVIAGFARPLPIDENEHPLLKSINSHIEARIEQIKQSLNGC